VCAPALSGNGWRRCVCAADCGWPPDNIEKVCLCLTAVIMCVCRPARLLSAKSMPRNGLTTFCARKREPRVACWAPKVLGRIAKKRRFGANRQWHECTIVEALIGVQWRFVGTLLELCAKFTEESILLMIINYVKLKPKF